MAFEDVEEHRSSGRDSREWCLVQNIEYSVDLYGELQNTAERFKILADRLQKTASKKDLRNEKGIQTDGCCEETKAKLMECIAENLRLRQSLKDVSDINHRWQDYNYDRQKQVQHLLSTVSELRRRIDAMKQESIKPTLPPKESEKNGCSEQTPSELCRTTTDVTKQQSKKSSISPKGGERKECDNRSPSPLQDKLSHEVRVLYRQLKDARSESKALKERLEEVAEENDSLRNLLKTYKSDWEDENRKKTEALSQAQRVVQELCSLKVNCQMQAEKLMKMGTVSYNCSLCQGNQKRQTLNNLSYERHSEYKKAESKERHKKVIRNPGTIIQSVDGIEVHLQERSPGEMNKRNMNHGSQELTSEEIPKDSTNPIVTFPDSDSDELTMPTEEKCVQLATASQHLICPVCTASFKREQGSQFLDHYTKCKIYPAKPTS